MSRKPKEEGVFTLATVVAMVVVVMKVTDINVVDKETVSPRVLLKVRTT